MIDNVPAEKRQRYFTLLWITIQIFMGAFVICAFSVMSHAVSQFGFAVFWVAILGIFSSIFSAVVKRQVRNWFPFKSFFWKTFHPTALFTDTLFVLLSFVASFGSNGWCTHWSYYNDGKYHVDLCFYCWWVYHY